MKTRWVIILFLLAGIMAAGCSNKGVRMPKHRKRSNCDCPTFSYNLDNRVTDVLAWQDVRQEGSSL